MRFVSKDPLPLLTWQHFDAEPVDVAITTRDGGVSAAPYATLNMSLGTDDDPAAVVINRERAAAAFGARLDDMVFCEQVHGATVAIVGDDDRGRGAHRRDDAVPGTDALVTRTPGVILAITVADCAPIVIYDPVARVLGCAHAGWRGVAGEVARATIAAMTELGADPSKLFAGIGPAVSSRTYDVAEDVVTAMRSALGPSADQVLFPFAAGHHMLDIAGALHLQLVDCGLAYENIRVAGHVTGADTPFFSHRAEQPCGRFALLARIAGSDT